MRAAGRTLHGIVMPYSEKARDREERFLPGSLKPTPSAWVEYEHDPSRILVYGAGVRFQENGTNMTMAATLPETPLGNLALQEVRAGIRTGLSVRFQSLEEREEEGVRLISSALLKGVGLVKADDAIYSGAGVTEVRAGGTLRASVPIGRSIDCRCSGPDCDTARIVELDLGEDLLGYMGDYSQPLGPAKSKIVKGAVELEIGVADGLTYGDDLVALDRAGVTPIVRPYPDPLRSRFRKVGRTLVYDLLKVAGWIVTFTDQRGGLDDAELRAGRRLRLWL